MSINRFGGWGRQNDHGVNTQLCLTPSNPILSFILLMLNNETTDLIRNPTPAPDFLSLVRISGLEPGLEWQF